MWHTFSVCVPGLGSGHSETGNWAGVILLLLPNRANSFIQPWLFLTFCQLNQPPRQNDTNKSATCPLIHIGPCKNEGAHGLALESRSKLTKVSTM
ncbi:hypothetical protein GGS20DRAFT_564964 [Poronia punctata]|nr:hypothetical protein GGS20DRAFT_564964 [Poronia punctata]